MFFIEKKPIIFNINFLNYKGLNKKKRLRNNEILLVYYSNHPGICIGTFHFFFYEIAAPSIPKLPLNLFYNPHHIKTKIYFVRCRLQNGLINKIDKYVTQKDHHNSTAPWGHFQKLDVERNNFFYNLDFSTFTSFGWAFFYG